MNIGEILIWESSNLLLLIPVVIGLVICSAGFSEGRRSQRDWFLLFGHPRFIDSKPHGEGWPSLSTSADDLHGEPVENSAGSDTNYTRKVVSRYPIAVSLFKKRRTIHGPVEKFL
jgi:hypothetical protein